MKILILKGGFSSERNISLITGQNVEVAIKNIGYDFVSLDIHSKLCIKKIFEFDFSDIDCVFIALHGEFGEDGVLQGLLDVLKVPYTHSGIIASSIAMNKAFTKKICNILGIRVPNGFVVNKDYILQNKVLMNKKYVMKQLNSGSSINVFIFENEHNFSVDNYPFTDKVLVEEYIHGYELTTVNLFGESIGTIHVLGVSDNQVDIKSNNANNGIFNYHNKYFDNNIKHVFPPDINDEIYNMTLNETKSLYDFLECRGIVRTDFRYDCQNNLLYMLEINTHPGMTKKSFVPEIAFKAKGITFDNLVNDIIIDCMYKISV